MSWFRVDDKAAFHKKVLKVGNECFGALVRMGCWASDHLTDGHIPKETAKIIAPSRIISALCLHGFLEPNGDDYIIHDFLDYNPTAEEVKAERERMSAKRAAAGRIGGIASGISRRSNEAKTKQDDEANASFSLQAQTKQNEAPSRPDPVSEEALAPPARESFDLDAICDRYPRRKGIAKGRDRLKTAIKTRADFEAVSSGLDRFIAEQKRKGTEIDFYPYFSTWVSQRRWEDDDDPASKPNGRAEPLPFDQVFTGYKDDLR